MFLAQGLEVDFESGLREAEKVEVVECLWDGEEGLGFITQHEGVDFFDVCCTRHGHYHASKFGESIDNLFGSRKTSVFSNRKTSVFSNNTKKVRVR